jgi:hypothetical protein
MMFLFGYPLVIQSPSLTIRAVILKRMIYRYLLLIVHLVLDLYRVSWKQNRHMNILPLEFGYRIESQGDSSGSSF